MKKFISLITAFVLMLPIFTISPKGAGVGILPEEYLKYAEGVAKVIKQQGEAYVFPEDCEVYPEELSDIISIVKYENPELFNVSGYSYSYVSATDKRVVSLMPKYVMSAEEYRAAMAEVEKWAAGVLSMTDKSYTPVDYALFFHDYLAANYEYDTQKEICTLYDFIKEGKGVCESYTGAYSYLLGLVGIDTSFAVSREMNHVWNLVKLDGKWYHVDVTWDDPTGLTPGNATHGYFLLSDDWISSNIKNHYGWVSLYSCTSKTYDRTYLGSIYSTWCKTGDYWYYMKSGDLYRTKDPSSEGALFADLNLSWKSQDSSEVYGSSYSTVVTANGKIYVSTPEKILEIDPASGSRNTAYTPAGTKGYIYGFIIDQGNDAVSNSGLQNGKILVNISKTPKDAVKYTKARLFIPGKVKGDADGNGKLNISDVTAILKYIAKWDIKISLDAADYDGSETVNITDITQIMQKIAGRL